LARRVLDKHVIALQVRAAVEDMPRRNSEVGRWMTGDQLRREILTVAPSYPARAVLDLAPVNWIKTRQRLIAEGRLKYIDLAGLTGARLKFRRDGG
jgi:hypothetical protein